jgi:hypothetical protein
VSASLTLSAFPVLPPPPSVRAPRTNSPTLKQFIFGPAVGSPATTTATIADQGTLQIQQQRVNQEPLTAIVPKQVQERIERFVAALNEALELSSSMVASEEADPLASDTLEYAIQSLLPFIMALEMPPPLILPLQSGGIGAEWHESGINVELRFRKPYDIYAVLEDAKGVFGPFHNRDPELVHARSALRELSTRSVG